MDLLLLLIVALAAVGGVILGWVLANRAATPVREERQRLATERDALALDRDAVRDRFNAAIRDLAVAIAPVIPAASAKLLDQMGIPAGERDYAALADAGSYDRLAASGFTLAPPTPIFPRLEPLAEG